MSRKVRSGTAKLLRIKLSDDTDRHANIFIEPRVGYRMENGVEPPLSIEAKSLLFSIAHNALRHAGASRVLVDLDYGRDEFRLSVSDDGAGLPDDYEERDHGFANMRAYAVIEAVAAGAAGYLQKVAGMDQVLGMMKSAAAGEGRLPTEVVKRVFDRLRRGAKPKEVNLTQREKEILVSFCRGMSYVAIAAARGVKVVTVRNAIYTTQVKLGVDSKQEIVVWAAQNGLLDD